MYSLKMQINVEQYVQRPWNKSIPLGVNVIPDKDYDVLEVRVRGGTYKGVELKPVQRRIRGVKGGKQYSFRFTLYPNYPGEYRVTFTVLGNYKGNVTAKAVDTRLTFNQELVKVPQDPGYSRLLLGYYAGVFGVFLVGVALGVVAFNRWFKQPLQSWYKSQVSPTFK